MQIIFFTTMLIAFIVAFIILFITKIGFREYVIVNSSLSKLSEMFSCDFCLSFWIGLVITLLFVVISGDKSLLLCVVTTPPITRMIL